MFASESVDVLASQQPSMEMVGSYDLSQRESNNPVQLKHQDSEGIANPRAT